MAGPYSPSTRITNILASTLEKWRKDIAEHIIDEIPLYKYMNSKGSKAVLDGGTHYSYPLLVGGQKAAFYAPGTQTLPMTFAGSVHGNFNVAAWTGGVGTGLADVPIMVSGRNDWSYMMNAIAITADERLQNMGDSQIASLIKGKIRAAELHMSYALNSALFTQGIVSTNYNFISLQAIAPPIASDLLCNAGADTILCSGIEYNNNSFNIAKWKNQYVLGQADYTDVVDRFLEMWVDLKTEGAFATHVIALHSDIYKKYESTAANNIKFMPSDKLDFGFAAATYKGIPMIIEDRCLHGTNGTDFADECAYFLNLDSLGFFTHKDRNIEVGPMIDSQAYVDMQYSLMKWMGGTWCNNRRAQGIVLFNS